MPTPELDILKPIDASITNSDDYEIFNLSNAQVSYAHNGRPANLLEAYADTPLTVKGRLETPDRSQMKYLVKKPFKPIDIEIRDVTRFSYGQTQDGEIVVWALGEAGWFELQPTRSYKNIFQDMVEAVETLYFITDIYTEPRKRGGGPSAQLLFQEYAEDERFSCKNAEKAAQIFNKHRPFLIMCFLNRAQGLGWSNTPIYQYYKRQFPKDFEIARARIEGKSPKSGKNSFKSDIISATSRTQEGQADHKTKSAEVPKKDDNWWEAAAIFEFMQKAVNQRAMRVGRVTIERVAQLITKRYEIEDIETAKAVLFVHAKNLRYMIDHPRRKTTQHFAHEPIYEELLPGHSLSAAEVRHAQSTELRPRKDRATLKEDSSDEEESSDAITIPERKPFRKKRGRLSVLRPKSSKYSGKGKSLKSGKGKGKAPNGTILINEESEDAETEGTDRDMELNSPSPTLSTGKRKHDPENVDTNPRKRSASESADLESSPSSEDTEIAREQLPLRWRSDNTAKSSSPGLVPPIVSTPLPTYTANGPGDSWICSFDGCSQRIYGASTDVGRSLVKEHLEDHAKGRQREIGILLSEEQRLRLPVNHLIRRIREMTERETPLFPNMNAAGPTAIRPKPIERKV